MKGMIYVDAAGLQTTRSLKSWLEKAITFVQSLAERKLKSGAIRVGKNVSPRRAK